MCVVVLYLAQISNLFPPFIHMCSTHNSCGTRIEFAQTPDGGDFSETEACALVGTTFPDICGDCNPETCNVNTLVCGCATCTADVLERDADGVTCAVRIAYLQTTEGGNLSERQACGIVAADHPDSCGPCSPCRST